MHKMLRNSILVVSVALFILSLAFTGCTRHPNDKQIAAYNEQVKATKAAEDLLQEKKQEKADLEKQLAEKQQELDNVKSEKAKVKERLGEK